MCILWYWKQNEHLLIGELLPIIKTIIQLWCVCVCMCMSVCWKQKVADTCVCVLAVRPPLNVLTPGISMASVQNSQHKIIKKTITVQPEVNMYELLYVQLQDACVLQISHFIVYIQLGVY